MEWFQNIFIAMSHTERLIFIAAIIALAVYIINCPPTIKRDESGRIKSVFFRSRRYEDQKRDNKRIIGLCEQMDARISQIENNDKVQIDTLLDSVRAQLREIHCRVVDQDIVSGSDWEVWHLLFQRYKSLGGNGRANAWNEDMVRIRGIKHAKEESK